MTVEVAIGQELFSAVGVVVTDPGFTAVAEHLWLLSFVCLLISVCLIIYVFLRLCLSNHLRLFSHLFIIWSSYVARAPSYACACDGTQICMWDGDLCGMAFGICSSGTALESP